MPENIGTMRQRVALYTLTTTQNDYGERLRSYTLLATVWADVQYEKGNEAEETGRVTATEKITVRIRYRSDFLSETGRLVWESKNWNVINIQNDPHRMYTTIRAEHQDT